MVEEGTAHSILVLKPQWKTLFGRKRSRRMDNIKSDSREIGREGVE
jgi:hypothetical protein